MRNLLRIGLVGAIAIVSVDALHMEAPSRVVTPRLNLLIVTLDTTRADHLGPYGYRRVATPALDQLASDGIVFEQHETAAPLTVPAHASILTGVLPPVHGVHDNPDRLAPRATLATILSDRGIRTGAFVGSAVLDRSHGLSIGFDEYDDRMPRSGAGGPTYRRPAAQVVDRAMAWMSADAASPFFAWVHLYDAHAPYPAPDPYATEYGDRPYDAAIAYADAQLQRLLAFLIRRGWLERTVVVVTADHGEALGEHGELTHALLAYEQVLRVPLVVRLPHARFGGRRVGDVTSSVDLVPTVLDLFGLDRRAGLQGEDLVPVMTGRRRAGVAYSENEFPLRRFGDPALHVFRQGSLKLIQSGRRELYDLEGDPGEEHNIATERSDVADRLARRLDALARAPIAGLTHSVEATQARDALASLGYVSR